MSGRPHAIQRLIGVLLATILGLLEIPPGRAQDSMVGRMLNDREGAVLGVVADLFTTPQSSIPLAALRLTGASTLTIVPLPELSVVGGELRYWGNRQQLQEIPKRIVILPPATISVVAGGPIGSTLSVLAVPSVPIASVAPETEPSSQLSGPGNVAKDLDANPYARARSDIKTLWGGANSQFRKPF